MFLIVKSSWLAGGRAAKPRDRSFFGAWRAGTSSRSYKVVEVSVLALWQHHVQALQVKFGNFVVTFRNRLRRRSSFPVRDLEEEFGPWL